MVLNAIASDTLYAETGKVVFSLHPGHPCFPVLKIVFLRQYVVYAFRAHEEKEKQRLKKAKTSYIIRLLIYNATDPKRPSRGARSTHRRARVYYTRIEFRRV